MTLEMKYRDYLEQGLEKGREQGYAKGIRKANLKIARKMIKKHLDADFIAEMTGLSIQKIQSLQ